MAGYLARRLAQAAISLVVAVSLVFLAVRVLPGNPLLANLGEHGAASIEDLKEQAGFNRPLYVQLGEFFTKLFTEGDLGDSLTQANHPVSEELAKRFPATVELTLFAMLMAMPVGLLAGIASAVWAGKWPDYLSIGVALVGVSVPVFFVGMMLQRMFPFMPIGSRLPLYVDYQPITGLVLVDTLLRGDVSLFFVAIKHLILPATALATIPAALIARITRSAMLEVLSADYLRTATAKGASFSRRIFRHALPNAAVPIANIAAFQLGALLSGAVLTETVFDWPGLGQYVVRAVTENDYTVVQGCALLIAVVYISINIAVDFLYVFLDPRIRLQA